MKARYSHILIDEYQDSGTEQHNLFLFLVELGLTGIAVGDVNQSIFAFDGKSSEYLTLLPNHGFKLFPLDINHRSHPSIINYSNRFLSTNSNNIETKEIMVFEKCCIGDESSIARWIGQKVPIFENEFDVKNRGQIGILVSNNSSGNFYDDNLTIPHQLITTSPLEHHSFTLSRLFTSLLYFYYDYSINALDIITNFNRNNEKSLIKKIQSNILNLRSFPIDLQIIDKFIEIASLLIPNTMNERSINLLTDVIQSENYLSSFKLPEESNVQIMTIHKAKGSEFDIVFHMNLYEWTLPRKSINEKRSSYFIDWDQDVNLHYVALTRARKALFLCYSTKRHNSKGMEKDGNPSEFLQINNLKNMRKII